MGASGNISAIISGILLSAALLSSPARAAEPQNMLGAFAQLGEEDARRAQSLVTTGKVYSLAVVSGPETPSVPGRHYSIKVRQVTRGGERIVGSNRISAYDDTVTSAMGVGTQLDGLGHIGRDGRHYGGVDYDDVWGEDGLRHFGIHTLPPVVTRGVVLDIAGLHNTSQLAGGYGITVADIDAAMKRQNVTIRANDVVLFHTGWLAKSEADGAQFLREAPGLTKEAARHLAAKKVVIVGADTWGVDVIPTEDNTEVFPVHQILLADHGIYILENAATADLVRDGVSEFMFVLGAPRFKGAVQAIVNPVAIR